MVLAEAPYLGDEVRLIVDVGTNAEIVFGNRERLLAASSPTGPAFEGAQISCGQRAAPGAIERIRIDRDTLEPRFKVIGCDLWSDEPGFAEATASHGRHRRVRVGDHRGDRRDVSRRRHFAGRRHRRRARRPFARIEPVGRTFAYVLNEGPPRLQIYQTDVRAIQLAKAALYAGAKLLIERRGDAPQRITLAGAFGAQIDPLYAMTLGLIPDCDLARVASAGNAAGTGARVALLNLRRAGGDRGRGAADREDRDGDRAQFPEPVRRGDGDPQQDRRVPEPRAQGRPAGAAGGDDRGRPPPPPRVGRRTRLTWRRSSKTIGLVEAMARLDALTDWERRPRRTMRVGLAPMLDLAARLGDPHRAFRSIHVAGTKGKGSVSALIEAALARAGLAVGRYGSPHVERVNERVSVGGRDVDDRTLARGLARALDAYEAARRERTAAAEATWFDLLTAAAFVIFREAGVEWAVVEVGLGGRLDSTNVVAGEIAVVTNIGLEHTEILGGTRGAIAGEKVGILKPGAVLVTTLDRDDEAGRVVQARADELGCSVVRAPRTARRDNRGDECRACVPRPRSARPKGRPRPLRRARSAPGFSTPEPASPHG